jgi:hypothetical protein
MGKEEFEAYVFVALLVLGLLITLAAAFGADL